MGRKNGNAREREWNADTLPVFLLDDDGPDTWGPTPEQEEGWDAREDFLRGNAL